MGHKDKLDLRIAECRAKQATARGKLAGLVGQVEPTAAQTTERDGLVVELRTEAEAEAGLQGEVAAAVELDACEQREAEATAAGARGGDLGAGGLPAFLATREAADVREFRGLLDRSTVGAFLGAFGSGRQPNGAEAELAAACGLSRITEPAIPLDLFGSPEALDCRGERAEPGLEFRADAPTVGPTTGNRPATMRRIFPAIFARSIAPMLGIDMPRVSPGDLAAPTITTSAAAGARAAGADSDASAVVMTPSTATPRRISARVLWRIEDVMASGPAYELALRRNVRESLADEYNNQCINGNAVDPNVNGVIKQLTDPPTATAIATFDAFAAAAAGMVDGRFAESLAELMLVVGPVSYQLAAKTFQSATNYKGEQSAAAYLQMHLMGFKTNSRMPAVDSTIQKAIGYRAGRRGETTAQHCVWDYVTVDDRFSAASGGSRVYTMHAIVGSVVQLVQKDAYALVEFKTA